jgi:hypothetical protein
MVVRRDGRRVSTYAAATMTAIAVPEHGYMVKRVARRGGRVLSLVSLNAAYPLLELLPGAGTLLGPVVLRWCGHGPAKPRLAPRP